VLEESPVFPVPSIKSAAAIDVTRQADEPPYVGVFDRLKVCIGSSSSHASGPATAAANFMRASSATSVERIRAALLAFLFRTDRGHAADTAVIPRLMTGMMPAEPVPNGLHMSWRPYDAGRLRGPATAPCFFDPAIDAEEPRDNAK
jgi:hypothetical protein